MSFILPRLPPHGHRRLTPRRLAVAAGGIGALAASAVLFTPSPFAYVQYPARDREPRSQPAAVTAHVATSLGEHRNGGDTARSACLVAFTGSERSIRRQRAGDSAARRHSRRAAGAQGRAS